MDTSQQRALNALEPYLALSRAATSARAAAEVISRATTDSNTYVFAELLSSASIQQLRGTEQAAHLALLELFSWGTWEDYKCLLPGLNSQQEHKLRQLSLLPLCTTRTPNTYSYLQSSLGLSTSRALEDVVISATYAGLITAKLSPLKQLVHVNSIAPLRDLAPGAVPALWTALDAWDSRCSSVLDDLEAQMDQVKARARQRAKSEKAYNTQLERGVAAAAAAAPPSPPPVGNSGGGKSMKRAALNGGADSQYGAMEMDTDEPGSGGGQNTAKKKSTKTKARRGR